ncbi:ribbon-helix-helix protein, CopG family [Rheinheimera sp. NSM]|uniref:ribbon-helix-helix protein, CopG family n=1 Tax=Rheinheimera sp. NSM TaxID=3457884 RepID=UPI004036E6A2
MALTDLKKKSQPPGKPGFTADEFIDDANNYAMGMPRIVSLRRQLPQDDDSSRLPMRHATFTLSQEAIDALNELSRVTGEAKSKLIRQLILQAGRAVTVDLTDYNSRHPTSEQDK